MEKILLSISTELKNELIKEAKKYEMSLNAYIRLLLIERKK